MTNKVFVSYVTSQKDGGFGYGWCLATCNTLLNSDAQIIELAKRVQQAAKEKNPAVESAVILNWRRLEE